MFQDEENYFHTVRWDSVYIGDVTDYLFNHKTFRETDSGFHTDKGNSWLGQSIRQLYGNEFGYIIIGPGDEIELKTGALLEESFPMYYYLNGDIVWGTLISVEEESFLSVTDTVKTFELQKKDVNGEMLAHDVNGMTIMVSKNYGMIQGMNFVDFPDGLLQQYTMTGIEGKALGKMNMTFTEAFNINVGDEIHEFRHSMAFDMSFSGRYIYNVLEVNFNINSTTLDLKVKRCAIEEEFENNELTTWLYDDTISLYRSAYDGVDEPCFQFPSEYPDIPFHQEPRTFSTQKKTSEYNGRRVKSFGELYNKVNEEEWTPYIDYYCGDYYIEGVGQYYHFQDAGGEAYLLPEYFKKGMETWGTPYHCDDLLPVKEWSKDLAYVYPNPAYDELCFSLKNKPFYLSLMNGRGQTVIQRKYAVEEEINLQTLAPGIYYYSIQTDQDHYSGKIAIQR